MRCAVVGVGYLGNFHAQKYKNNPKAELVGVYDSHEATAQKVAKDLNVRCFKSLEEMRDQVQAVTIAAATQAHFEIAKFFLRNKIAVNVEKPMTATLEQAESLLQLVQETGIPLSVGHIERFNPSIVELRKNLQSPLHFEFKRLAPFKLRGSDVSVLYDLMIHDLDLALWLTGSEPVSWIVKGSKLISKEWDTCQATFKMKNGITATIEVSRVSPVTQRSIKVTQAKSILSVNTGSLEITQTSGVKERSDLPPASAELMESKVWTVEKRDALQEETNAFIEALIHKTPTAVTVQEGYQSMKWIAEIEKDLQK